MPDPDVQAKVTMALNRVQEEYPNDFAYARGGEEPTLAFRASAPAGVRAILAGLPQEVKIVEGAGFAEKGVVAKQHALNAALVSSLGPTGIGLAIDETGTVNVTTRLDATAADGNPAARTSANVNAILAKAAAKAGGVRMRLIDSPSTSSTSSRWTATGGTGVASSQGGSPTICTEGFIAKSASNGDLGPLIAGHCTPGRPTFWHNGNLPQLDLRISVQDSRGDAAFYRSSQMMAGIIRVDWSRFVGIHGHYDPVIGNSVCRFGIASGAACQKVIDLNRCFDGVCGLVWTDTSTTQHGDSGGPWYYGSSALGIHRGYLTEQEHWYSIGTRTGEIFTPISTVLSLTKTVLCYDEAPDPKCVAR